MLLSGWRALYRKGRGNWIDWAILGILAAVSLNVAWVAFAQSNPRAAILFALFALGGASMVVQEIKDLQRPYDGLAEGWLTRHVAA